MSDAASGIANIIGGYMQAREAKKAARAESAQVDAQAANDRVQAAAQEKDLRRKAGLLASTNRAAAGARGVAGPMMGVSDEDGTTGYRTGTSGWALAQSNLGLLTQDLNRNQQWLSNMLQYHEAHKRAIKSRGRHGMWGGYMKMAGGGGQAYSGWSSSDKPSGGGTSGGGKGQ